MSVYVDPLTPCLRSFQWPYNDSCHLFADSLEELHKLAGKIGLKREWFQGARIPHYDLTAGKRELAVRMGAVELTRDETVALWRKKGWITKSKGG